MCQRPAQQQQNGRNLDVFHAADAHCWRRGAHQHEGCGYKRKFINEGLSCVLWGYSDVGPFLSSLQLWSQALFFSQTFHKLKLLSNFHDSSSCCAACVLWPETHQQGCA